MADVSEEKCLFYDTGYCKFSKTKNGCNKKAAKEMCAQTDTHDCVNLVKNVHIEENVHIVMRIK